MLEMKRIAGYSLACLGACALLAVTAGATGRLAQRQSARGSQTAGQDARWVPVRHRTGPQRRPAPPPAPARPATLIVG